MNEYTTTQRFLAGCGERFQNWEFDTTWCPSLSRTVERRAIEQLRGAVARALSVGCHESILRAGWNLHDRLVTLGARAYAAYVLGTVFESLRDTARAVEQFRRAQACHCNLARFAARRVAGRTDCQIVRFSVNVRCRSWRHSQSAAR